MELLVLILLGALVGWLASIITKRDAEQGWVANVLVGIVGMFVGQFVSRALTGGNRAALSLDVSALLWSLAGAVIVCWLWNWVTGSRPVR